MTTRMAAALLAGVMLLGGPACAQQATPEADLARAFDDYLAALRRSADYIQSHPFYGEPENRAAGMGFLASMTLARIEEDILGDPDFPYFRVLDQRIREGGDNPDQTYFTAVIRGGESYRIWGRRGGERRLDLQVYAGDPYIPGAGRAAAFLGADELKTAPDGSFEVFLTPERRSGNWLENPKDGTQIWVRQIFSDWNRERPGELHIDRIGHEGDPRPAPTDAAMAARLRQAGHDIEAHVRAWPTMVEARYLNRPANELGAPFDPGALGGVPGRWMVSGSFDLAPDEALIVRTWPASGSYQGIQLADLWFSSLEYGNRQTSLTGDQARLAGDGSFYFVIAAQDPGVANWLDTTGRRRGLILLRYDGMTERRFDPAKAPTATRVKLAELRRHLPPDIALVTPEQRTAALAARRRGVQERLGR